MSHKKVLSITAEWSVNEDGGASVSVESARFQLPKVFLAESMSKRLVPSNVEEATDYVKGFIRMEYDLGTGTKIDVTHAGDKPWEVNETPTSLWFNLQDYASSNWIEYTLLPAIRDLPSDPVATEDDDLEILIVWDSAEDKVADLANHQWDRILAELRELGHDMSQFPNAGDG